MFNVEDMLVLLGANPSNTGAAISKLEESGIVRELTGRKRDRVWFAVDVSGELDDLERRIAERVRALRPAV